MTNYTIFIVLIHNSNSMGFVLFILFCLFGFFFLLSAPLQHKIIIITGLIDVSVCTFSIPQTRDCPNHTGIWMLLTLVSDLLHWRFPPFDWIKAILSQLLGHNTPWWQRPIRHTGYTYLTEQWQAAGTICSICSRDFQGSIYPVSLPAASLNATHFCRFALRIKCVAILA